ncbi:hypothetical protein L519_0363 [Bordetella bronchiseptica MBORD678]|nr:hypothetical protein L519_0363 [Bordetella bronchiseptica MBORD678]
MQGKRNAAATPILSNSLGQGPCLLRTNGMWNPGMSETGILFMTY